MSDNLQTLVGVTILGAQIKGSDLELTTTDGIVMLIADAE